LLAVLIVVGTDLCAQQTVSPFEGKKTYDIRPGGEDKVTVARRLIGARNYQAAADLLELVYISDPDNGQVQNLLRNCYDHLRQYAKAELLVRRILEIQPSSIGHQLYLAETLVKLDKQAEALQVYEEIAQGLGSSDPSRHLILVNSLIRSGLDDEALATIENARQQSGNSVLFAVERGSVLEKRRQYLPAAREYLQLLAQDTVGRTGTVERRLIALLEFEESSTAVEELLINLADSAGGLSTVRMLSDHFLKSGRFEEAFDFVIKQDSLEGRSGFPLVGFMRRCQDRRCWPQAARMAEIVLQQHPGSAFETEVSFEYARALAEMAQPEEALAVYERLFRQTEDPQVRADALYGAGVIYLDYVKDGSRALEYLDSVIAHFPRGRSYFMARKAAALCQLREGHLDDARRRYTELGATRLPGELKEEILFYEGLVDFFDLKFDSSRATFQKLTLAHPQGYFVNDALQLVLAIDEASEAEPTLSAYAQARFLLVRGRTDSARTRLSEIADGNPPVLGDIALFRLIDLELGKADSAAALGAIERLDVEHPDSYYRPLGLKIKADMLAGSPESRAEARELYRTLLENHPEYPFVREIRDKLRRFEESEPVG
jgi:tetratricopeptide (TPR) repeat protein